MAINDPRDIPGLWFWGSPEYEAANYADGQQLTTVTDLSGNNNHATAFTVGSAKPLWKAAGGPNGGARFRFENGGYLKFTNTPSGAAGEMLQFVKGDADPSTNQGWDQFGTTSSNSHYPYSTDIYDGFAVAQLYSGNPTPDLTAWHEIDVSASALDYKFRIDGVTQFSSGTATMSWRTSPVIGNGKPTPGTAVHDTWEGDRGLIVIVARATPLTTTERADLSAWAATHPSGGLLLSVPNAPTSLGETHDQDSIDFTWAAPSGGDPATGYKVRIDSGSWIDVGLVLAHTFSGLSPSTTYAMDVRAYNAAGDGPLASLNATTDAPPTPNVPTSLGETHDQDSINFTWAAPSGGAAPTGYEARISGGGPVDVGNAFAHEFTSLAAATPYDLEVRAYNGAGSSAWALLQATTDPAIPPPPLPPGQFPDVPKPKPVQRPMRRGWRYFATRLNGDGTETLLNIDLPLENVTIEDILSGDGAISGTISPVYSNLIASDGEPLFQEWSTALYAEQNGSIRAGAILTNSEFDGPDWSLEATGFTSYLRDLPYIGPGYKGIHVDPIDVVRTIWAHAQSKRGGNLGMVLDTTTTGGKVDIGTELKQVAFDSVSGPISFESGPYKLNEYSSHDLAQNIDDLANETPFDYHERHYWSGDQIIHRLDIGYPRIGRRREDLRFLYGVNIFDPVALNRDGSGYASGTLVLGAGDGASAIRAVSEPPVRPGNRLRRIAVVVDDTIKSKSRATKRATAENQWRARLNDVDSVVVQDHPNARLGAAQVGDEIRLEGQGDWIGIDMWVRILAVSYQPANGNVAEYSIVRTDRLMS